MRVKKELTEKQIDETIDTQRFPDLGKKQYGLKAARRAPQFSKR